MYNCDVVDANNSVEDITSDTELEDRLNALLTVFMYDFPVAVEGSSFAEDILEL
jgi:hypothetical protein